MNNKNQIITGIKDIHHWSKIIIARIAKKIRSSFLVLIYKYLIHITIWFLIIFICFNINVLIYCLLILHGYSFLWWTTCIWEHCCCCFCIFLLNQCVALVTSVGVITRQRRWQTVVIRTAAATGKRTWVREHLVNHCGNQYVFFLLQPA